VLLATGADDTGCDELGDCDGVVDELDATGADVVASDDVGEADFTGGDVVVDVVLAVDFEATGELGVLTLGPAIGFGASCKVAVTIGFGTGAFVMAGEVTGRRRGSALLTRGNMPSCDPGV
jgi:hypothetical protein